MKIKICGLFREEDAIAVNAVLPDYAGFIFVPESRRFIEPEKALELRRQIDARIVTVGVFRDAPVSDVAAIVRSGAIGAVQLHGGEDAAYIEALRTELSQLSPSKQDNKNRRASSGYSQCPATRGDSIPTIKAISVKGAASIVSAINSPADLILFDNGDGGTGERFDASLLRAARDAGQLPAKPFFIAGGVTPENIGEFIALAPYGIDVSGGAETDGLKDAAKIAALVDAVRKT